MRNVETNRAEKTVKKFSMSAVALVLVSVMIFGCAIGGTLAWLTTLSKETVKNVFVLGDIKLSLSQSGTPALESEGEKLFEHKNFLPGSNPVPVDPKISVGIGSVKCYVFVMVSETENFSKVGTYEMTEGWIPLLYFEDTEGEKTVKNLVFYRIFDPAVDGDSEEYNVIKDGVVRPLENFPDGVSYSQEDTKLNFKALACQFDGVTQSTDGTPNDEDLGRAWAAVYSKLVETLKPTEEGGVVNFTYVNNSNN
jgi:hypothetical protein